MNPNSRKPREIRTCAAPGCDITFEVTPRNPKRFCCSGHSILGRTDLPKTRKLDPEVEAILKGEKEAPLCGCGCGNRIVVTTRMHYYGIPKFINFHAVKKIGSPFLRPDVQKKLQASYKDPVRNEKISQALLGTTRPDIWKSALREGCNQYCEGPDWYLSNRDFCLLGVHIYSIQYMRCSHQIRRTLKKKGLVRLDLLLFLNFVIGHTLSELTRKYGVNREEVYQRLKHFSEQFPGCFQEQPIFRGVQSLWLRFGWVDCTKIVKEF